MRFSKFALALAAWGAVTAGRAQAQTGTYAVPRQPAPVTRVAYNYDTYYTETEPPIEAEVTEISTRLDAAAGAGCTSGACDSSCSAACGPGCASACGSGCAGVCQGGCGSCGGCGSGCSGGCGTCCSNGCGCGCGSDSDEPWRLLGGFTPLGFKFGGWIASGIALNSSSPNDRFNGPVTWIDRSNEFGLQELWTYAARDTDTGGYGFDLGGRVDTLYGTSARFNTSAGLEDRINKSQAFYGLAIPNLYAQVGLNNWTAKLGHFVTPCGYQTVGTYYNFFNLLPYTFQYGEPFTHTGMMLTNKVSDQVTLGGVLTRGWDNSGSFNPHLGVMGFGVFTGPSGNTLAYHGHWSQEPNFGPTQASGAPGFSPRWIQTLVYSRALTQVSENLNYVFQSDFGQQSRALADGRIAHWYGVNQYLFLKTSCRTSWGINFEWFRDEDGFRVGGFLPNYPNNTFGGPTLTRGLPIARSGYRGNFYQVSMGPKIELSKNLILRSYGRFDWFDGSAQGSATGGLRPFGDGNKDDQFLWANDLILVF